MATVPVSAMSGAEMVALCKRHTIYEWSAQAAIDPIPVARAEGVYFWTPEGQRYLDFNSQLMCTNIGHGHPAVVRAIQEQAAALAYANPFMATEARARLGAKLAGIAPGDIDRFFFTNGGAEANENAIRIARIVTGRPKVLARYRAYHGATARRNFAHGRSSPVECGARHPRHRACARPFHRWGRREPEPVDQALADLEDVIRYEGAHTIAAFIMEPVVGTNGLLIPPDGYLQGVRALCDTHGILLIADEVMSGFGRTGRWFAVDHWAVVPDLITMAKGLTSAYVAARRRWHEAGDRRGVRGPAVSGRPDLQQPSARVRRGARDHSGVRDEGLIENARRMGVRLRERMQDMERRHRSVGATRSIGLFGMFELVRSRKTYEPWRHSTAPRMRWSPSAGPSGTRACTRSCGGTRSLPTRRSS